MDDVFVCFRCIRNWHRAHSSPHYPSTVSFFIMMYYASSSTSSWCINISSITISTVFMGTLYICPVAKTWRRVWGRRKNFSPTKMTFFSEKISILTAKISDDLFLVIDQVFRIFTDFPDLYFLKCRTWPFLHDPFLTRKTPFLLFSYFRAHPTTLIHKILGGTNAWAVLPSQTLGDRPP